MTIVVAGGSGFVGGALIETLLSEGHTVVVIDKVAPRRTHPQLFFIQCDVTTQALPYNILEHTDAVINLVGEPIVGKWTAEKMTLIRESRIKSTTHIVESIAATKSRPGVFICASAIGFYGDVDTETDEQGQPGSDFLADVVTSWEAAAREATQYGVRVVCVRTAPVLGDGGILSMIRTTAPFGFLLSVTKNNPWFSWIHIYDLVQIYRFALETTTLQGVVNASAPEPVRFTDFMKQVSLSIRRPLLGVIPEWIVKAVFGKMREEFNKNSRVLPRRLLDKGFVFEFPTIDTALQVIADKK